ncbi:MAG: DUF2207 domain-containing protein [Minisyncoccia bacterium]
MKKLLANPLRFRFNKTPRLWRGVFAFAFLTFLISAPLFVVAQENRHYEYANIQATYRVLKDATVSVEEILTYDFAGEYHQGYRGLSHKGSDEIRDVEVWDLETGERLRYSSKRLDKLDPESWGAYTTYENDGATNVEWYYNLKNTAHSWKITYTLYGAVAFYTDHDELYWNVFSGLDAPVRAVEAVIIAPGSISVPQAQWYLNGSGHTESIMRPNEYTFRFVASDFSQGEPATFAAGWQKGLVDERAYWQYLVVHYWPYALAAIIGLGSIVFSIWYWFVTEHRQKNPVVVAEYDPPSGIRPAMASLIVTEGSTTQMWPATIIDLAVRGHIHIQEEKGRKLGAWFRTIGHFFLLTVVGVGACFLIFGTWEENSLVAYTLTILTVMCFVALIGFYFRSLSSPLISNNQYLLQIASTDLSGLREYEKNFLKVLFGPELTESFSTKEIKKDPEKSQEIFKALKSVGEKLTEETDGELGAYLPTLTKKRQGMIAVMFTIVGLTVFLAFFLRVSLYRPYVFLVFSVIFAAALVAYMLKFESRLTPKGQVLYTHLRGFREYLHTAERYRMQNLTPEIFEKYLPYAMIFSVEKEWAKAFRSITMQPPSWYQGTGGGYIGSTGSSFSSSAFATGFSASLSSAFASSGGGASGGGGSAGGGGGGGGGGAS